MSPEKLSPGSSESWQPDYIAQHRQAQGEYLRTVADTPFVQQVAAQAMELLMLAAGHHALEVGCGNGVFLPWLAAAVGPAGHVTGIDYADAFVAEARTQASRSDLGNVAVQQGDACALAFADASFDAAHCERVLMHLEDPNAALSEMARVVRPGGWVVAAEPDWGGIRIDHPDRSGFDTLYARALKMRHPDMGLTLYRRMGEVGLVERQVRPVMAVITDFGLMKMYGLELPPAADALVSAGALTRARADALLAALEEAGQRGRFCSVGLIHVAAGRVPD